MGLSVALKEGEMRRDVEEKGQDASPKSNHGELPL